MGAPIPRQQFAKPPRRESGDAGEHIGEPGLWIDIIKLGRHDQRCRDRGAVGTSVGAGEQPGFTPQRYQPFILPMSGRK